MSKVNLRHQGDAKDEVEEADKSDDDVFLFKYFRELVRKAAGASFKHPELKVTGCVR